jgi:threonine aldolase
MRQAGVLAAAGLVGLTTMVERLGEDHDNARRLANGLAGITGLALDTPALLTNIVYVKVAGPAWHNRSVAAALKAEGILCNAVGDERIRFVTHHGIGPRDIDTALSAVSRAMSAAA